MPNIKISQLPYVGKTGYTPTDIVPFVSYINPTGTTSETKIDDLKDYILDNSFVQNVIKVGKGGNVDFTSLNDAIQSITDSSANNRYTIQIGPGVYVEPPMSLMGKEYISIVGDDIFSVVITPNNPSNTIIRLGSTSYISFLTISGATSGVGIACDDLGGFALVHKISMYDNDVQITVTSSIANTQLYGEYIDLNGYYSYGVYVIAQSNFQAFANLENHFNFPSGNPTIANFCQGQNSVLNFDSGSAIGVGVPGSVAFWLENDANMTMSNSNIVGWDTAIKISNNGGPSTFDIDGVSIRESVSNDLLVEHIDAQGTIQGSLSHSLINNVSENVFWSFLDHTDGELDVTRKISVTFKDGTRTDLSTLLFESNTMGVLEGGLITILNGLTISVSEGYGYLESIINNTIIKRYDWIDLEHELPPNSNQYIYINNNGLLSNSGTRPNSVYNIVLGRVVTNSTDVIMIDSSPLNASHTSNLYGDLFRQALGPIYDTGSIVTENVTPYHLDVTGGDYFYSTNHYSPSGGTDITFTMYFRDGITGWTTSATTEVVNGYDDGSGTISPLSLSAFTKHTLYVVGEGVNEQYFLVLGQNQYPTLIQTENGLLPLPPSYFDDSVTQIASIYIQQGQTGVVQIEDIRPVIGFKAGGVNASSVHGNLLGLSADDHTQYLLVDGSRAMEGDINMNGNNIYSADTVTTNTISATTYENLPIDVRVTGGTYSSGTATFTNNTGGTFSVSGFSTSSGTNPFRAMYDMAINVQSVSILNALEGTSIPDGASDSYTKTIPLPFVNPDLVYCVIQSRNFFNQGFVPITFGFTTQGAGFITTGSTSNSDLRFIVTNNYTEVRIAGINRLDGISSPTKFIDDSGVTIPGGIDFPTYSQQNNNLVGIYSGPGGTSGILGYTSSSGAFQSHSVLKSAYINGNNLVLLFKKRIVTTSELWTILNINVYNIS